MNIKTLSDLQAACGTTPDGKWGPASTTALKDALASSKVIQITDNISLNELVASNTAKSRGIDNTPSGSVLQNLIESSHNLWQPVRDFLGAPIRINSGYRSPALNAALSGSAKNSAHMYGLAIDFVAPSFGSTRKITSEVVKFLNGKNIAYDQLIIEYPTSPRSWVHLAYKHPSGQQRRRHFQIG